MNYLTPGQWIIVAVFAVLFLFVNASPVLSLIGGLFSGWTLPTLGGVTADQDEVLDMRALHRLEARFQRLGCAEGQAALKTAGEHFFHVDGGKPA